MPPLLIKLGQNGQHFSDLWNIIKQSNKCIFGFWNGNERGEREIEKANICEGIMAEKFQS